MESSNPIPTRPKFNLYRILDFILMVGGACFEHKDASEICHPSQHIVGYEVVMIRRVSDHNWTQPYNKPIKMLQIS